MARKTTKKVKVQKRPARRPVQQPSENGHFQDGTLTIDIQGGPHDGKSIAMDLTLVGTAAHELARKHRLREEDGQIQATAEFLQELDKKLQALGYTSTPTIAAHAWQQASDYFARVQKKTHA